MSAGPASWPGAAPCLQASLQSSVMCQSDSTTPSKPKRPRSHALQQLPVEARRHALDSAFTARHVKVLGRHVVGGHDAADTRREGAGEGLDVGFDVATLQRHVAAVVVVRVVAFRRRRAIAHPVLDHRHHAAGGDAVRAVLHALDIGLHEFGRPLRIAAEGAAAAVPARVSRPVSAIGDSAMRIADGSVFLADEVGMAAHQFGIARGSQARRVRPLRENRPSRDADALRRRELAPRVAAERHGYAQTGPARPSPAARCAVAPTASRRRSGG